MCLQGSQVDCCPVGRAGGKNLGGNIFVGSQSDLKS